MEKPDLAWKRTNNPWFHHQIATLINSMGRKLVNERECKKTPKMAAIKRCRFQFLKLNKLHLVTYFNLRMVGKYILLLIEYISLFRLVIYVLLSFTRSFSTFSIGLLFTHTLVWVYILPRVLRSVMEHRQTWSH